MANTGKDRALQLNDFFVSRNQDHGDHGYPKPANDWLLQPEMPQPHEIMASSPPELLRTLSKGHAKQEYLEKQYRMQRYEAIEPTRKAVSHFRWHPEMMEDDLAYIYTNVKMQGFVLTKQGAAARFSFSTRRASDASIDWANSDMLKQGSLVVLSRVDDAFRQNCLVATVAYRYLTGGLWPDLDAEPPEPANTPPRIDLYFASWSNDLLDTTIEYYMLEAKNGYFESCRPVMLSLQTAVTEESVQDKYVVPHEAAVLPKSDLINMRNKTKNILDPSQQAACQAIMTRELAIVQGPPGTGKTFTATTTIEEIIRLLKPTKPLIVAAQSNHAVDQLLDICLVKGLTICRLGSRTVSEEVEKHSLFLTRQKQKKVPSRPTGYRDYQSFLDALHFYLTKYTEQTNHDAMSLLDNKIITEEQYASLQDSNWETSAELDPILVWLGWNDFKFGQSAKNCAAAAATATSATKPAKNTAAKKSASKSNSKQEAAGNRLERDPDKPTGPYISIASEVQPPPAARLENLLQRHRNLYKIKVQHREEIYNYMCYQLANKNRNKIAEAYEKFTHACARFQQRKDFRDEEIIKQTQIQVIGCTITGLSKYRRLLKMIEPTVLIIDEASEATEGSVVAALLPSVQHLALIGDHQQLTPRPIHRNLAHPDFALDVSLFERLVTNGFPYEMLQLQRRMIPEIREMMNKFYPQLQDHDSVMCRDEVKGVEPRLLWFDHAWPESRTSSSSSSLSYANVAEADMIVGFAMYLLRCGVTCDELTILTFYKGQQELIQEKLGMFQQGANICKTVDSFQGCENRVVILSVVRGPEEGGRWQAGFVENIHRATVALSRARDAFYIFGNARNLEESNSWSGILKHLGDRKSQSLPLTCPVHGTKTSVRKPEDWSLITGENGCHGKFCEGRQILPTITAKVSSVKKSRQGTENGAISRLDQATMEKLNNSMAGAHAMHKSDGASSTVESQDFSTYSSDYMMKVGYTSAIAEFDENTDQVPSGLLVDLSDTAGDLSEPGDLSGTEEEEDLISFD